MRKFKVIIEKTRTGYCCAVEDLSVFTTGSTLSDLKSNLKEALELRNEDEDLKIKMSQIELHLDFK